MLTYDEIIANVQNAFLPLRCDAQIRPYDLKLNFKISDCGKHIVRMGEVDLVYAQDKELLASIVRQVRERVQDKGYVLH